MQTYGTTPSRNVTSNGTPSAGSKGKKVAVRKPEGLIDQAMKSPTPKRKTSK